MKRILLASFAIGLIWVSTASAMVTISKHNFTSTSGNNVRLTADPVNGEVCVFCHTPHGAKPDAPLWNRQMATSGAYTPYTSSTIDAEGANAGRQPMGISLACLSCHDGTIAIDALYNAPGSGNYSATATSRTWSFNAAYSGFDTATNTLAEGANQPVTNLTQNISGQHPISIRYANYTGYNVDAQFYQPNASNTSGLRWFDDGDGKAEDNEIRLFATTGDTSKVYVECASCHNPHGTQNSAPGDDFPTFLRKSNNQSALCTTCHIK